jgi:hypothetical protein
MGLLDLSTRTLGIRSEQPNSFRSDHSELSAFVSSMSVLDYLFFSLPSRSCVP